MRVIDLHQDLILRLRSPLFLGDYEMISNDELLEKYPKYYQLILSAIFTAQTYDRNFHNLSFLDPFHEIINQIIYYDHIIEQHAGNLVKVITKKDYEEVKNNSSKTGFLYYVEGLYGVETISDLEAIYKLGVRGFTLAWNHGNSLASGCKDNRDVGLTSKGEAIINFAKEKNMLIDLVHVGKKTAMDILELTERNVFVSHTGLQHFVPNSRNIDDEIIQGIVERDGVIGLIFFRDFLEGEKCPKNPLECFFNHVSYLIDTYGYRYVAFGSDFYGIPPHRVVYSETKESFDIAGILDYLEKRLSKKELEAIAVKNFERLLLNALE